MSLLLENGTNPHGFVVKSMGEMFGNSVLIGQYKLSMDDFCAVAYYVLTNTDLCGDDDPRVRFIADVKNLVKTVGFNAARERLEGISKGTGDVGV